MRYAAVLICCVICIVFFGNVMRLFAQTAVTADVDVYTTPLPSPTPSPAASPQMTPTPAGTSGGTGGGGGGSPVAVTQAIFRGKAYPKSAVHILKNGVEIAITPAGDDANFQAQITGLYPGFYTFSLWSEDARHNRSIAQTYTIYITSGVTTVVSGIFMPPTISLDKTEVRWGDVLTIIGQTVPEATVSLFINSDEELVKKAVSDADGGWIYKFDTSEIEKGKHTSKARTALAGDISSFSDVAYFTVGDKNVAASGMHIRGDMNNDGKVDLADFSITAYWYGRPLSEAMMRIERNSLNGDGKINLSDFSIMAYYFTG